MTNEEINKLLAEKVMGWRESYYRWLDTDGYVRYDVETWSPATNIAQALEAAEKICADLKVPWRMGHYRLKILDGSIYWFEIGALPGRIFTASSEHMALAVCLCCLKAVEPV